jgi:hypothetical protein
VGKGNTLSNSILNLIFNATPIANIADNAASAPLTEVWIALHTADPTASGNQTSNEASYTGYARVSVARDGTGWSASSAESLSPLADITFPAGTGGGGTATFWSIGTAGTGTGELLYSGPISPTIALGAGITPQLTTASTATES